MKAVVLEVHKHECAVLREDGTFDRVPGRYQVGETIELSRTQKSVPVRNTIARWILATAAVLTSFMAGGAYYSANVAAAARVTYDADAVRTAGEYDDGAMLTVHASTAEASAPSVGGRGCSLEFTINSKGKVTKVTAINPAKKLRAEDVSREVKGKSASEAIVATNQYLTDQGVLSESGKNDVLVSVTQADSVLKSGSSEFARDLTHSIKVDVDHKSDNVTLTALLATPDEREAAISEGMSTGRYKEYRTIIQKDGKNESKGSGVTALTTVPTDIQFYKGMSVTELVNKAKEVEDLKNDAGSTTDADSKKTDADPAASSVTSTPTVAAASSSSSSVTTTATPKVTEKPKPTSPVQIGGGDDDSGSSRTKTNGGGSARSSDSESKSSSSTTTTPQPQIGGTDSSTTAPVKPSQEEIGQGGEAIINATPTPSPSSEPVESVSASEENAASPSDSTMPEAFTGTCEEEATSEFEDAEGDES